MQSPHTLQTGSFDSGVVAWLLVKYKCNGLIHVLLTFAGSKAHASVMVWPV